MAKNVILVSTDETFKSFLDISVRTLTKLNHFTTLTILASEEKERKLLQENDVDLIIIDLDSDSTNMTKYIQDIRAGENKTTKIISVVTNIKADKKKEIFESGCDVIIAKAEFYNIANNILQF